MRAGLRDGRGCVLGNSFHEHRELQKGHAPDRDLRDASLTVKSVPNPQKEKQKEKCSFDREFCVPFLLSEVGIYSPLVLWGKLQLHRRCFPSGLLDGFLYWAWE